MDWISEMREGMKMMAKACAKNEEWSKCNDCPFCGWCDILMKESIKDGYDYDGYTPEMWMGVEM